MHIIPAMFLWIKNWYSSLMMGPFDVRGYPLGGHELLFPFRYRRHMVSVMAKVMEPSTTVKYITIPFLITFFVP
jgi:hypothetical protein